jgi:hypothetical protein
VPRRSTPSPAEHDLIIVVFSALIAALPAFAIGLALLDQPGFRSMVEARVCAPGENVGGDPRADLTPAMDAPLRSASLRHLRNRSDAGSGAEG